MIFNTDLELEELIKKGKYANWKKPDFCPCCHAAYWWHGFRERWCGSARVFVRRIICSDCHKTRTLLPKGFLTRFQVSMNDMLQVCRLHLYDKIWHSCFLRQRIRWWIRVAEKMIRCFGDLDRAIKNYLDKPEGPVIFSRVWLTHQRVS